MTFPETITEALAAGAASRAGFTYVGERGTVREQSHAQLAQCALRAGGSLAALGLPEQSRVVLIVRDPETFLSAFFGCAAAGLVPVPLPPPVFAGEVESYGERLRRVLDRSNPGALITDAPLAEELRAHSGERRIVSVERLDGPPLDRFAAPDPDSPAMVQYTSGSTSEPRGVILSHRNLSTNISALGGPRGIDIRPDDFGVTWLPLFHDMGLIGAVLAPLYFRASSAILPTETFIKRPSSWLQAIARFRATVSFAPNFGYALASRRIASDAFVQLDLSCWRVAGCGAEPIQPQTLDGFREKLEPAGFQSNAFFPCYGLAEHTVAATVPPLGRGLLVDPSGSHVGCGRPFPGHALSIELEDGSEAGDRQVGEIRLRGPSVSPGYEGSGPIVDTGGWLHTGDLGYLDAGELFVCGRIKELIIINGKKYHPQDVEWSISEVVTARQGQAVAFGARTREGEEHLVVVVESPRAGSDNEELRREIRHRVRAQCGLFAEEIIIVPRRSLPKTSSGKLRRTLVKRWYETGELVEDGPPR